MPQDRPLSVEANDDKWSYAIVTRNGGLRDSNPAGNPLVDDVNVCVKMLYNAKTVWLFHSLILLAVNAESGALRSNGFTMAMAPASISVRSV